LQFAIEMFPDEEVQSMSYLLNFAGKQVSLQVKTLYDQEQKNVILMWDVYMFFLRLRFGSM